MGGDLGRTGVFQNPVVCMAGNLFFYFFHDLNAGNLGRTVLLSAQSGFYWYNGGIHYVGMHGFGLLFLAVSICLERAEGRTAKGLLFTASVLLAMITAGSNFVTALQGLLCLVTILLVSVVLERRKCGLWLLPATAVYIMGFGLNVAAPGNSVRAQSYIGWG